MVKTKVEWMAEKMKNEHLVTVAFEEEDINPFVIVETELEVPSHTKIIFDFDSYYTPCGSQGRKGERTRRMNLAIQDDVYEFIRRESRKTGMTYSEYICAMTRCFEQFLSIN